MTISADVLRAHIAYSEWASTRLLESASQLTPAELSQDFKTADRSVEGTLFHIYGADRLWLQRFEGLSNTQWLAEADRSFPVLQAEWPRLQQRWRDWAAKLSDEVAAAPLTYLDLEGRMWTQPLWQLALHVVNHATHHRGQVSGFLRALGRTPPALDLDYFYSETAN